MNAVQNESCIIMETHGYCFHPSIVCVTRIIYISFVNLRRRVIRVSQQTVELWNTSIPIITLNLIFKHTVAQVWLQPPQFTLCWLYCGSCIAYFLSRQIQAIWKRIWLPSILSSTCLIQGFLNCKNTLVGPTRVDQSEGVIGKLDPLTGIPLEKSCSRRSDISCFSSSLALGEQRASAENSLRR